jgi:glutamyl/glutaminyl-tRNA synthetase
MPSSRTAVVTRINPTPNGPPHIGHWGNLKFLEQYVKNDPNHTGKLLCIFDDQIVWKHRLGIQKIQEYKDQWKRDIEWTGIKIDSFLSDDTFRSEADRLIRASPIFSLIPPEKFHHSPVPFVGGTQATQYPYAPRLTITKVAIDYLAGCTLILRGSDILDESLMYWFFCDMLAIPMPEQLFVPRIDYPGSEVVSKTNANLKISSFREKGRNPKDIERKLAESYLINPDGEWIIENCKVYPIWLGKDLE